MPTRTGACASSWSESSTWRARPGWRSAFRLSPGAGTPSLLDLHRLQFIDSSGLRVLVGAVTDARRENRSLVLDGTLSPQVRQIIELLELRDLFWPPAE